MSNYPIELPHGAYHRRIVLIPEDGRVRAALEDESHSMELTVFHDGTRVTDIQGKTHRVPWNTCPSAVQKVRDLVGLTLRRMHETTGHDAKAHCTHLFDLARLAIARAVADVPLQYDVAVEDRVERKTCGILLRDGQQTMVWDVTGNAVTGPDPFTGHSLRGAPQWPNGLDDEMLEAALVMRRVFLVSQIREPQAAMARVKEGKDQLKPDFIRNSVMLGRCFSFQEQQLAHAESWFSWRDFADRRDALLAHFPGTRTLADLQGR
jgi:hypothetical protein